MGNSDLAMHYVCTHEKARQLVDAQQRFWVSNCGCRESRGECARSRMDVCLMFTPDDPGSGTGKREITRGEVDAILEEAAEKFLVTRPWRNEERSETVGICFCCDDCCDYFLDPNEKCDKGELVARTDFGMCTHCSACVDVCYFHARAMEEGKLVVEPERCYGCGLCAIVCPEGCIRMVSALPNPQQRWLDAYDALPGLLNMAWQMLEATGLDLYRLQEELRAEYRRRGMPFRWSMPHRRPYSCDICGYSNTDIEHELENPTAGEETPTLRKVGVSELAVHQVREHGAGFAAEVEAFLGQFAAQGAAPDSGVAAEKAKS